MTFRSRAGTSTVDRVNRVRADGTASKSGDVDDRIKARAKTATAYERYKEQLNEFFDGKRELPDNLKNLLATRPGAEEHGFVADEVEAEPDDGAKKRKKKKGKAQKAPSEASASGTRRRVVTNDGGRGALVEALRKASSPREVESAVNALKGAGFSLPHDLDLMSKALGHSDEEVIAEALRGLVGLVDGPAVKGANLLKSRLKNVALMASSSEVKDLCGELQAALS